ncbi:S41 family peptidase [Chitinophaga qingshengii]|uniref:Tail specific protease domain-containing protein n=1 Tax=Chitinophaga qingshengii TaxID=1569794 RepID=A0ABR7TVY3_9BACT|nr:S41 family peptidase [Chitinophaga qingshengii]MBC9934158.1 hypothetical protein [Chitinophaga qingshengii]
MFKRSLIVWLALALTVCHGGTTADKTIENRQLLEVAGMQKDLTILWEAFRDIHPAYGLYTSGDSLQAVYKKTRDAIRQPLSENEFIAAIYPFVSALKCGHTQVKNSVHYKPVAADGLPQLPFQVLVQNDRVWVTTHQLKTLQTGDELLSINGVPVADIVGHGADLYAADGNNRTFKELFLSEYGGFEDACNKYYRWKPPYEIKLKTLQGTLKSITADTLPDKAPLAEVVQEVDNYKDWSTASSTDYLPLRFLNNSTTASFEVHTYQYGDTLIYEKAFREIREKGIKNLIIDLRHNTGGDLRVAAKLLTYLADTPFQMVGDLWARVPDPGATRFEKYFDTARTTSFIQSFKPTGIRKNGHYQIDFQPDFGPMLSNTGLDKKDHYNGKMVVLIDGATFSSGAHTAAVIKQYCPSAVFIGRETAGGSEGCSGGSIQRLTLPNTGIVIEFPLLRVVSVLSHPTFGHGIIPDYVVAYTPMDILTKKDLDLQKALEIIAR